MFRGMLTLLRITNLGLIRFTELELGPGLIVVTGESGAGKSTVFDALSLLAGQARPRSRPAPGQRWGLVEAAFTLEPTNREAIVRLLDERGLASAGDEVLLGRRIESSGRSRCYVQGQLVPRTTLAAVCSLLLERCGQSEALGLRTTATQLEALDHFANLENQRAELARLHRRYRANSSELEHLRSTEAESERQRDFVEFQVAELQEAAWGDYAESRAELERLTEAVRTQNLCHDLMRELGQGPQCVRARLGWLQKALEAAGTSLPQDLSDGLAELAERCDTLERQASHVASRHDTSPGELERLKDTVERIDGLARKHRVNPNELDERRAALEARLEALQGEFDRRRELEQAVHELEHELRQRAEGLHSERKKAARLLEDRVNAEFPGVELGNARFSCSLSQNDLGSSGCTHLEMGFSANPGSPPAPLARVASGGELARILLCLRLSAPTRAGVLTFDEIDAGLGGHTAERVGQALLRVAEGRQVLCITHWPQVAGLAHQHLTVKKSTDGEITLSEVLALDRPGQIDELSRMLGGQRETAVQHAAKLIPRARKSRAA